MEEFIDNLTDRVDLNTVKTIFINIVMDKFMGE